MLVGEKDGNNFNKALESSVNSKILSSMIKSTNQFLSIEHVMGNRWEEVSISNVPGTNTIDCPLQSFH
jgi:hypothetical protein